MNLKKLLISGVIVGTLIIGASMVGAQDGDNNNGRRGRGIDFAVLETYTALTREEIITAVRGGETIASLIEANGQSVDAFIAEAVTAVQTEVDERLAEGKLTAERAEEIKASAAETVTAMVNGEQPLRDGFGEGGRGGRNGGGRLLDANGELAQQYTGLDQDALREALRNGQTLAELIQANGQSVEAFISEAVVQTTAELDARTAEIKANLESTITALVNGEQPEPISPEATATPNA